MSFPFLITTPFIVLEVAIKRDSSEVFKIFNTLFDVVESNNKNPFSIVSVTNLLLEIRLISPISISLSLMIGSLFSLKICFTPSSCNSLFPLYLYPKLSND
jgi:hypothetical protein